MIIYKNTNYRKIYEQYNGPIPKDDNGRTYDIHHIDGNNKNNNPDNLVALSIMDHYNIHMSQGDHAACLLISNRMNMTLDEKSELARQNALKMVAEGKHPFLGPEVNHKRILDGTHSLVKRPDGTSVASDRVVNGTHHFLDGEISRRTNERRVNDGSHHLFGGEIQRVAAKNRVDTGTHNFLGSENNINRLNNGTHPSQINKICEHCGKTVNVMVYGRLHGTKCKY